MHSVTDGWTDGQQDDANSRSYCVAVRSAKNENKTTTKIYKLQKGYIKTQLIAVAKNHPINWN